MVLQFIDHNLPLVSQIVSLGGTYLLIDGILLAFYVKSANWLAHRVGHSPAIAERIRTEPTAGTIYMNTGITRLVFDLGRVIVELRGPPILNAWAGTNHTPEEIWQKWLTSNAPRAFKSGLIDKNTFASMIVEELSLSISTKEFLDYFTSLPIGPHKGAGGILQSLRHEYKTAFFSSSNVFHWERKMNEMKLGLPFCLPLDGKGQTRYRSV